MDIQRPTVLLVGESAFYEFCEAVNWLETHTRLVKTSSVSAAFEAGHLGPHSSQWHTVVFAQSRPGRFSAGDIERVSQIMPLAHLVALLGSWCEGETRSGKPWPGVVRVYWHQWLARCESELRLHVTPTSWQLPRTTSDWERTNHAVLQPSATGTGLIAIHTRNASCFHALARACRTAGYAAVRITSEQTWSVHGATAVLWNGQVLNENDIRELTDLVDRMRPVPVIALLAFTRYDQVQSVQRCGVTSVLSYPFLLPDLWTILREVSSESLKS